MMWCTPWGGWWIEQWRTTWSTICFLHHT